MEDLGLLYIRRGPTRASQPMQMDQNASLLDDTKGGVVSGGRAVRRTIRRVVRRAVTQKSRARPATSRAATRARSGPGALPASSAPGGAERLGSLVSALNVWYDALRAWVAT